MARGGSVTTSTSFSTDQLTGTAMGIMVQNDDPTDNILVHVEVENANDPIHTDGDTSSHAILGPGVQMPFFGTRGNLINLLQIASAANTPVATWSVIEV